MTQSSRRFVREQLAKQHVVADFDCGEESLNTWLHQSASDAIERGYSRVYVWHPHDNHVVGYFTLSSYAIGRGELPAKLARGEYRAIPSLLLGKLALDTSLQGQGLAAALIADAVVEAVKAAQHAAARYLVVDALNEGVADLYEKLGFVRAKPGERSTVRLLARLIDLQAALTATNRALALPPPPPPQPDHSLITDMEKSQEPVEPPQDD